MIFIAVLLSGGGVPCGAGFSTSDGRGTRGPAILRMPAGVRALGLGGSYVAVADDASAPQWNPAGLQRVRGKEVQLMRADLFADQTQQYLGYAHPLWRNKDRETWGVNVNLLDVEPFDVQEEGQKIGSARPREWEAGLSYARPFWNLDWGATGKFLQAQTYEQRGQSYAFDVGVLGAGPTDRWSWGVALANIGPALTLGNKKTNLATVGRAGVAWTKPKWGSGDFLATGEVDLPLDDTVRESAGIEYSVPFREGWRAAVRGGIQHSDTARFSAGFGVKRRSLGVNYTFFTNGDLGNAGYFDFSFQFGGEPAAQVQRRQLLDEVRGLMAEGNVTQARDVWGRLNDLSPRHEPVRALGRALDEQLAESLDPSLILGQGKDAFQKRQYPKAADLFRKLLLVVPNHPDGKAWLDKTEKQIEADRLARLNAEVAVGRERERRQRVTQAEILEARGQWSEAIRAWGKVRGSREEEAKAQTHILYCKGKMYGQAEEAFRSGNTEKAIQLFLAVEEGGSFQDAGSRAKSLSQKANQQKASKAQQKYREGRTAYVSGNLKTARGLFEEAYRLDPDGQGFRQALDQVNEELRLSNDSSHGPSKPTRR